MTQTAPPREIGPDGLPIIDGKRPWPALWALVLGFFMILVDSNIVSIAMPRIMSGLGADITQVMWVTSAYLLAYAVPLLITGRLGDRFGPRTIYTIGLVLFTAASLWCGFSTSVESLISARVLQGFGAACMSPQTMSVITRMFPPERRGTAMALWGSVAGVATLVGPILGGILTDTLGWEWIFFVNVPVGVVAVILALRLVPRLETTVHRFDVLGIVLNAAGMFCLVFAIQEGSTYHWGTIRGWLSVPLLIGVGLALMVGFVIWQGVQRGEPLLPLDLFGDRNFSLANVVIFTIGIVITAMAFPLTLYAQLVHGLSPTETALLMVPMAVLSIALAPYGGRLVNRINPKKMLIPGLIGWALGLLVYSRIMGSATVSIWWLLVPATILGVSQIGVWGPNSVTATRNLPMHHAGAGSGVYNLTRQMGAVLGSAIITALLSNRLTAHLGAGAANAGERMGGSQLPEMIRQPFAQAMSEAMLLPAVVLVVAVCAAVLMLPPPKRPVP